MVPTHSLGTISAPLGEEAELPRGNSLGMAPRVCGHASAEAEAAVGCAEADVCQERKRGTQRMVMDTLA